jgi:hypothetical protein
VICKEFSDPSAVLNLTNMTVEGDVVYSTWTAETPANSYQFGTDAFLIRHEKFVFQTFAGVFTPKS